MPDFLGLGNGLLNVVILLAVLVVLVVIHEFGHFIVARRAGVTVHEFGIGFPPRALTFYKDKKGTIYTLNWLPIGGFVRMEGEDGESDDPNAFVHRKLSTRLTILLAGVTMNLLLAFVLFTLIAGLADPSASAQVLWVEANSPASQAGLVGGQQIGTAKDPDGNDVPMYDGSGDRILAVDGQYFSLLDLPDGADGIRNYLRAHAGATVTLTVLRPSGETVEIPVTLRPESEITPEHGALGFRPQAVPGPNIQRDFLAAIGIGAKRTVDSATLILRALGDFVTNLSNPQISGPVGMIGVIDAVRAQPFVIFVYLIALLSANLAVVNALPLPPLDGGRVAVSLTKAAFGDRVSVAFERYVYLAGFVFLMAILAWVTLFDTGILQRT